MTTLPEQSSSSDSKNSAKKSKSGNIFLNIALGCFVLVIIGGLLGFYIYQQLGKQSEDKLEELSFEDLEKSIANLPSTEELDKIAASIDKGRTLVESKSGKVGDELSDDKVSIKINSLERKASIKDNTAADDYEYIVVNMKIKNITQQEISVFTSNFTIRDNQSNEYQVAVLKDNSLDKPIAAWQYISAAGEIVGDVVFTVKKDVNNLKIVYNGNILLEFDLVE